MRWPPCSRDADCARGLPRYTAHRCEHDRWTLHSALHSARVHADTLHTITTTTANMITSYSSSWVTHLRAMDHHLLYDMGNSNDLESPK